MFFSVNTNSVKTIDVEHEIDHTDHPLTTGGEETRSDNSAVDEMTVTTNPPLPVWSRRLRELRALKGWSQQELGEQAGGIATATISTIERGGHSGTETLERLARALAVSISLLFTEDGEGVLTPTQASALISRITQCVGEVVEEFRTKRP
jgi:transcriptional regulator with XRE-family HTH domain